VTSEAEGPGSAQLRVGAAATAGESALPLGGALLGQDPRPDALLVVALVAAVAFVAAALQLGARPAPAAATAAVAAAPVNRGRRALLLGAGGGAAVFVAAWTLRGRQPIAEQPAPAAAPSPVAPTAVASAPAPAAPPAPSESVEAAVALAPSAPIAPDGRAAPGGAALAANQPAPVASSPLSPPATAVAPSPAAPPAAPDAYAADATYPSAAAAAPSTPVAAPSTPVTALSPPAARPAETAASKVAASAPTTAPAAPKARPTQTMPGGRNNYVPNAPLVPNLGTGFVVAGKVLDASTLEPVRETRIQIWLNTARGGERVPSNRGSVMTDREGRYRLETSPVVPQFGQPHVHIAYDDGKYDTLFLRPVLKSEKDPSITVDFILGRSAAA
jgi:hypothetical protein